MNYEPTKIKLVLWDLDETFWKGTLSEGPVSIPPENILLIKSLTDDGIINTVCSKNDKAPAEEELKKAGILEDFVFNSIDWTPKGQRIQALIATMALRDANVLFVDDNPSNLEEAKFYSPHLMTALPSELDPLREFAEKNKTKDPEHKRLKEYKVLETKNQERAHYSSNEDFLLSSQIELAIGSDCLKEEKRLFELVNRTNQLNYTKKRPSEDEFIALLNDPSAKSRYVVVRDRFGEYGIVGFATVKDGALIHFLFSCRTMGMGIERYFYCALGKPSLKVVEPVSAPLDTQGDKPSWIHEVPLESFAPEEKKTENTAERYLFKGPCDMLMVFNYLKVKGQIETEFTHNACNGTAIESSNHTTQILEAKDFPLAEQKALLARLPFGDDTFFSSKAYGDYRALFLSTFTDGNLGLYQDKQTGKIVAFGEYLYDLTDEKNWPGYLSGAIYNAGAPFNESNLKAFQKDFTFLGRITPEQCLKNLQAIRAQMNPKTTLVLFLGSETPFLANKAPAYERREEWYKTLNSLLKQWSVRESNIRLIDFNDFIHSQNDFAGNINHFTPEVYYQVAEACSSLINEIQGENISITKSKNAIAKTKFKNFIKKILHRS
jgi:FkbH-like protein